MFNKTRLRKILSPEYLFNSKRNKAPNSSICHTCVLTWSSLLRTCGRLPCLLGFFVLFFDISPGFCSVFLIYPLAFLNLFLSTPLFPSLLSGHGFGSSKMSRAQTFPSYASEQSEETQQSLSRSSSYGFSYSSSLIQ